MDYGRDGVREIKRSLNSKTNKLWRALIITVVQIAVLVGIGVGICGVALGFGMFRGILADTPRIRLADVIASGQATIVYDAEGNEIDSYVSMNSNRIQVGWDQIPKYMGFAFVACEDERFYQHGGIDYKAIVRSGYQYVKSGFRRTQGGSTITQQLLKNTVFTTWTEEGDNMMKKIKRKVQEQYLALEVTKKFTKDEILLRYMNAINLGQGTLGVESASLRYFGKSCIDLTISECAVIAVITQNPSGYNPISHPENNARRRKNCLDKMLELGFITADQYTEAIDDTNAVYERIGLFDTSYRVSSSTSGSYFSDALYEQVFDDLVADGYTKELAETMLTSGGLRIESTLDPTIQAICNEEAANPSNYPAQTDWYLNYALTVKVDATTKKNFSKENMSSWFKSHKNKEFNLIFHSQDDAYAAAEEFRLAMMEELGVPDDPANYEETVKMTPQPQVAFVVSDPKTGYVVAVVGGRGAKEGRRTLNRAVSSTRSPGSTFKVLASFAPAIDCAGMTLATVYNDAAFSYDNGTPVNNWYKTGYRGIRSIRYAIQESMNIIAVKNLTVITPQLGFDYLVNFGFTSLEAGDYYNGQWLTDVIQPLALGGITNGVSPYELNAAYASIENQGTYVAPKLYTRVLDSDGNVILDNTNPKTRQVLKETTAYLLTSAMQDVITKGTATACKLNNMNAAGKTGTTTKSHDVWFAGFTPYYCCTVWTGYDNNIAMVTSGANRQDGISKAIWKSVMSRIHEELPNQDFPVPEGITKCKICSLSGKLPREGLCDVAGCVVQELFAEGTEPTEYCDIHYEGEICAFDNLIACDECPFRYHGTATLPLIEDPALTKGSTMIVKTEDGGQTLVTPTTSAYCQHNAQFYQKPNAYALIEEQRAILAQRIAAIQQ